MWWLLEGKRGVGENQEGKGGDEYTLLNIGHQHNARNYNILSGEKDINIQRIK